MKKRNPNRQSRYLSRNPYIAKGKITLYLGSELKAEAISAARARGNSVSGIVRVLLRKWIEKGKI